MAEAVFNTTGVDGLRPSAPIALLKVSLTGPTSYATGGITGAVAAIKAAALADGHKLNFTKDDVYGIVPIDCKGYQLAFDNENDAIIWYYGDNNNSSDGPAVQVANTDNHEAVTVKFTLLIA